MKKFIAIFISFILIFSLVAPSYANLLDGLKEVKPDGQLGTVTINTGEDNTISQVDDRGGSVNWLLQIFLEVLESLTSILTSPIRSLISRGIFTIEGTIWARQPYLQLTFFNDNILWKGDASAGDATEFNLSIVNIFKSTVASLYNGLRYLVAAFYVIILVYLGIRMILSSIGRQKAHYKELLKYWLIGLLFLFAFHWVMAFMIWGAYQLTDIFADLGESMFDTSVSQTLGELNGSLDYLTSANGITEFIVNQIAKVVLFPATAVFGAILALIGYISLLVISLKIAFSYLQRLFTIAMLIILFPLVVLAYVFDKIGDRRSQTFSWWIKEFTVNVFIQPLHAFILALIAAMLTASPLFTMPLIGAVLSLLSLSLITRLEDKLKTIFQIQSNTGPGHGGIARSLAGFGLGLGALKGIGSSAIAFMGNMKGLDDAGKLAQKQKARAINSGNKAYNNVLNNSLNKGMSKVEARKKARAARQKAIDSVMSDQSFKNTMKKLTGGYDNIADARKAARRKLFGSGAGMMLAIPQAMMGTKSFIPELIGKMAANAATGGTLAGMANDLDKKLHDTPSSPELDKVKKLMDQDPKTWSKKDKELISAVTGVPIKNLDNVDNSTVDLLKRKVASREEGLKFGITFDNPDINMFDTSDDFELDELRRIYSEDKEAFNQRYECKFTQDGAFFKDTIRGKEYFDPSFNCSALGNSVVTRQAGMTDERFEGMMFETAKQVAAERATRQGYSLGSKEHEKIREKELERTEKIMSSIDGYQNYMDMNNVSFLHKPILSNPIDVKIPSGATDEDARTIYKNAFDSFLNYGYVSQGTIDTTVKTITNGTYTTLNRNNIDEFIQNTDVTTLQNLGTALNTAQKMERKQTHGAIPAMLYADVIGESKSSYNIPNHIQTSFSGFAQSEPVHVVQYVDPQTSKYMTQVTSFGSGQIVSFETPEDSIPTTPGAFTEYVGYFENSGSDGMELNLFDKPFAETPNDADYTADSAYEQGQAYSEVPLSLLNITNSNGTFTVYKKEITV